MSTLAPLPLRPRPAVLPAWLWAPCALYAVSAACILVGIAKITADRIEVDHDAAGARLIEGVEVSGARLHDREHPARPAPVASR